MTIYIHEDNYGWLINNFRQQLPQHIVDQDIIYPNYFIGINIKTCSYLPKWQQRWEFPATPFVKYTKEDESWAIPIRFGHYINTDEPYMLMVNEDILKDFLKPQLKWMY